MSSELIRIMQMEDSGDQRGSSFPLPASWNQFLPTVADAHITTLHPGHTRGNHYHARHKEILIVLYADRWSFHWDTGPNTVAQERAFEGKGAMLIEVMPTASHAVVNGGGSDLCIIGLSNLVYEPAKPDSYPRIVT